ncbi:Na+/H+ antiporter subunit E [Dehalococcoidia bacterium]|nr:Na+/H+ antiporter subunit E [Dehalococcoidia bacterium]
MLVALIAFLATAALAYLLYLALTTASGDWFLWSKEELIIGAVFALIVGAITGRLLFGKSLRMLNPRRWVLFLVYLIGPFFWGMAKANVDVAYRVITGRINPGIVKISPGLKTDLGITLLANSITLTPGTLSVEVDEETNELYIHWINVKKEALEKMPRDYRYVCEKFPDWARRVAE